MFKFGYVTIIGKPNAGKSTLVNKLVGFKVAITTPKPQTTRFNIKGIITNEKYQIVFIDTPGVHLPKNKMGEYMMEGVRNSIKSVDVIIYLVDATKSRIDEANKRIMEDIVNTGKKVILCINKIDKVKKENILKIMDEYNQYFQSINGVFKEIIPISIYKNDGLDILLNKIEQYLPEGNLMYQDDEMTDITEREIVEELIREKALNNLDEEVPHGIKVEVEQFKSRENINNKIVYDIEVNIICEKMSHKGIIIGKDGEMLKKIRSESKREIEKMLEEKVNLKIWVKMRKNWQQNDIYLQNIKNKI